MSFSCVVCEVAIVERGSNREKRETHKEPGNFLV
jgi:hypothetical protein